MDDFYFKILNIQDNDNEKEIINTISMYLKKLSNNQEGMCKVHSLNLKDLLNKKKIKTYLINSLDLGATYEHHFLLALGSNDKYYIIDLTYSQFDSTNKILINKKLSDFPSAILCNTDFGKEIYQSLIKKGYCITTLEGVILYLNSLDIKEKYSLAQIFVNSNKKQAM